MKKFTLMLLGCALFLGLNTSVTGHTNVEYFMPQVPDPGAITIDGNEDDWDWMEEDFKIGLDQTWDSVTGDVQRDGLDFSWFAGWSAPPDNRVYFFIRVQDDTLRLLEEDQKRWWSDDHVQIYIDADHSGGNFLGENLDQVYNGQRYHLRIKPLPGQPVAYNSLLEYIDLPEIGWSSDLYNGEPTEWFEIAWTLLPAAAGHLSTNITWTMEFRAALWDIHNTSPETSTRHILQPDKIIHFGARVGDSDGEGAKHRMVMIGAQPQAGQKAQYHPDWILLEADEAEAETAVRSTSWGRIKSHLGLQLR